MSYFSSVNFQDGMQVGESLPLPIIHISAQFKAFKIKVQPNKAKSINNVGSKIRLWGLMKVLNFKIKFSQITAKITIMVI